MKFNKKLVVTSLSTVLGLGIVGSITGTVAWYQYSTRATASLVGVSAGESGVLQISADGTTWKRDVTSDDFFTRNAVGTPNNGAFPGVAMTLVGSDIYSITLDDDYDYIIFNGNGNDKKTAELEIDPAKDYYVNGAWAVYGSSVAPGNRTFYYKNVNGWESVYAQAYNHPVNYRADNKLRPCTYGALDKETALPAKAYGNPAIGVKEMTNWNEATKEVNFFQYTVHLRTIDKGDSEHPNLQVSRGVWITEIVLADANNDHAITSALRMHLHVSDGVPEHTKNYLIANDEVSGLKCYGALDLDGDGENDKVGEWEWSEGRDTDVIYGDYTNGTPSDANGLQRAYGISDVVATSYNNETKQFTDGKFLGNTKETTGTLDVTVTVWIEGWAQLVPSAGGDASAIWDGATLGRTIHAGIKFDVGDKAFTR